MIKDNPFFEGTLAYDFHELRKAFIKLWKLLLEEFKKILKFPCFFEI